MTSGEAGELIDEIASGDIQSSFLPVGAQELSAESSSIERHAAVMAYVISRYCASDDPWEGRDLPKTIEAAVAGLTDFFGPDDVDEDFADWFRLGHIGRWREIGRRIRSVCQ
jgi:hypothetical protein